MTQLQGSFQIISNPHVLVYLLKGLVFTLIISAVAVLIGIAFGSVLALVRNYCTTRRKLFGLTSVETGLLFKGAVALILFTSSIIAEIVRGGLNAIPKGQFEAAHSQGFGTVQTMRLIILPQAFRHIVPTLLSQVITTIKDSSYLANIAVIELMARTRQVLSAAYQYNGTGQVNVSDVFVLFGFAFAIYFIINFALSLVVRRIRKNSHG